MILKKSLSTKEVTGWTHKQATNLSPGSTTGLLDDPVKAICKGKP